MAGTTTMEKNDMMSAGFIISVVVGYEFISTTTPSWAEYPLSRSIFSGFG
ncbi:hypothetical protein [Sulfuriflexus mobilis]|nr:hypothetical protein [Sulfuriflexus mobilis]